MSTEFLSAARVGDEFSIEATVDKIGKKLGSGRADFYQEPSRVLFATGTHVNAFLKLNVQL